MMITDACEYFMIDRRLRGSSDATLENYRLFLASFTNYLKTVGVEDTENLSALCVNKYHLFLKDRQNYNNDDKKLTLRTIQTYLRHVKVFVSYCSIEGILPEGITKNIILPKAEKPVIKILTDNEIVSSLSSFNLKTECGLRDYAICFLMLDCGLRAGEVCNLKIADLNFDNGFITVELGKGNKSRVVPFGFKCRKAVAQYLYKRRLASIGSDYLFLSVQGEPLNVYSITRIFTKIKKRTGISRIHAHLLRHPYVKPALKKSDLFIGQTFLRIFDATIPIEALTHNLHCLRTWQLYWLQSQGQNLDSVRSYHVF